MPEIVHTLYCLQDLPFEEGLYEYDTWELLE
jgi:hypothetical protein